MQEWYSWGWGRPKRMTRKEIQEMVNNMKKTWLISEKSNKYHEKEELEADNILKKLDDKKENKF